MLIRRLPFLLLPLLVAVLAALPAHAQIPSSTRAAPTFAAPNKANKQEPAPPALPGARAEPTAVAPAERSAADLPPTEALFDAINRGDLPTARDAVNRGADLNGTNVLGLTPLELAVDLGRNEISFLLLSLRGGNGFNNTVQPGNGQPAAAAAPGSRAERLAAARAERAEAAAARAQAQAEAKAARAPSNPVPQTARLFAGGGGTPVPQAGFLGFDAGR